MVNSKIKLKPINQSELDDLQYLSGYIIRTLLKRAKNSKTHLLHENQIISSILSNALLPDFAEKQNQKLVDIQTRGGLTKVVDEAQEKHFHNFKCINHFTKNFTNVLSVAHLKITAQTAATYLSDENAFTILLYFKARAD